LQGQQGQGHPQQRPQQHDGDLAGVAGEQIFDETADVVVDDAAFFDGGDDGGEVVVEQHQGGCFSCHVSPPAPHRDADMCRFQGRGIIHPVTGHRHHFAIRLQGPYDVEFLFGNGPRNDSNFFKTFSKRSFVHLVYLRSGQQMLVILKEDLATNTPGCLRIITGDH